LFLSLITVYTNAFAQKEEQINITTYYPSPSGVYQTIRLNPQETPPGDAGPGQLYYNITSDSIMYFNRAGNWTPIIGGGGGNVTHIHGADAPIPTPIPGNVYFDKIMNRIRYYNNAGKWVNMSGPTYWTENLAGGFYGVGPANNTVRRVGIGTNTPTAPLSVHFNDDAASSAAEQETVANFSTLFNNTGKSQYLSISLFPNGTYKSSYLDSTSLISVPNNPPGNLKVAACDAAKGSITFNVGGYNTSASEVLSMRNPCFTGTKGSECPRVGIGNSTSPFALFVDSNIANTTALAVRGNSKGVKSGIGTITPYNDSVWITYGCYLENNTWKHSAYSYPPPGNWSRTGAAFVIKPSEGAKWYAYNSTGLTNNNTTVGSWNVANNVTLWYKDGLRGDQSSRTIKENFTPLNPDELLRGIDQVEVTRWNYKASRQPESHIGPVSEDFNQVFNLGTKDGYILNTDVVGVSLAGIKALSGRIKAQKQMINELKSELKYLESQLSSKGGL
jgi:hypothetical protein